MSVRVVCEQISRPKSAQSFWEESGCPEEDLGGTVLCVSPPLLIQEEPGSIGITGEVQSPIRAMKDGANN
jgi:hypothetical protein